MTRRAPTILLGLAFVTLWSSGFVGAELGTRVSSPDTLLMWRMVVASILLGLACLLTGRRLHAGLWRRQVPLGVLMQLLYLGGVFSSVENGVSGGTVALIAALQPVLVVLVTIAAGAPRPSLRAWIGLALGLIGVGLVVGDSARLAGTPVWAFALPIGAMLALSAGTLLAARFRVTDDLLSGLTVQSIVAAAGFTVWALARGNATPPLEGDFVAAVAWTVVLAGFGGYGAYLLVLRRGGPQSVSALLFLTPPTTALWTSLMFDVPLRPLALLGMGVSALGVAAFVTGGSATAGLPVGEPEHAPRAALTGD